MLWRRIFHNRHAAAGKRCSPDFLGEHHPVQNLTQTLIRAIPRKDLCLIFQRAIQLFITQCVCKAQKTLSVPGFLAGEDIKEIHSRINSFRFIPAGM